MNDKICVIGLGYIGLPTALVLADHGVRVVGVDVNENVVNTLKNKQIHIEEKGAQELLEKVIESGTFKVSTTPEQADAFIISVPSPITDEKKADLDYVRAATKSIVPYLQKGNLVILESTVPPRTVEDLMVPILEESGLKIGEELYVAHSPERVLPGKIFHELVNNDRIIGGINEKSGSMAKELYEIFVRGKIHLTDATTAEFVKLIENTYRDVNIAFANELAKICENIGVDVWEAIKLANYHPRVNIHFPGPGVGGHCIAVDPWFLVELQPDVAKMIHLARNINDGMPKYTANKVREIFAKRNIKNGRVAVFGLAFKGNVDDMRESPSFHVIDYLEKDGFDLSVYDPHIKVKSHERHTQSFDEAVNHSDMILILTNHDEFNELDPTEIQGMRTKIVFDTKNCIDRQKWLDAGFEVITLGDTKNRRM